MNVLGLFDWISWGESMYTTVPPPKATYWEKQEWRERLGIVADCAERNVQILCDTVAALGVVGEGELDSSERSKYRIVSKYAKEFRRFNRVATEFLYYQDMGDDLDEDCVLEAMQKELFEYFTYPPVN